MRPANPRAPRRGDNAKTCSEPASGLGIHSRMPRDGVPESLLRLQGSGARHLSYGRMHLSSPCAPALPLASSSKAFSRKRNLPLAATYRLTRKKIRASKEAPSQSSSQGGYLERKCSLENDWNWSPAKTQHITSPRQTHLDRPKQPRAASGNALPHHAPWLGEGEPQRKRLSPPPTLSPLTPNHHK